MENSNTQILLASRPTGVPQKANWLIKKSDLPTIEDGEVLLKIKYISIDPAMRGWINDTRSYIPPVQIGEVMRAGTIGEIIASNNDKFQIGDTVTGWNGVQTHAVSDGKGLYKVDGRVAPLPTFLGTLGMPGMTGYFGLLTIGQPKEGETLLVSGAAGAVGSVVGQIAKIKGCRVVGIAGGEQKCAYIKDELGFDGAIDYKNESVKDGIKRECPKGIDIYFDNVGGEILDTALTRINMKARIVICGAISQYNNNVVKGPSNYLSLLVNRARMEGMVVMDYAKDYGTAVMQMAQWMGEGKLKSKEFIVDGIETFPDTLLRLFSGDKMGKLIIKV